MDVNITAPEGLSPRVRGKPVHATPAGQRRRSIPACAGEVGWWPFRVSGNKVYPRVCGGSALRH